MASIRQPKEESFKLLERVNIWKPDERNGKRERTVELVIFDTPRFTFEHSLYIKKYVFDPKIQQNKVQHNMYHFACNLGDDERDGEGYCDCCEKNASREPAYKGLYRKSIMMVPVVEISRYNDRQTGEPKVYISKKLLPLNSKNPIKYFLEKELGEDYDKWIGAKIELTRIAGDAGSSTGNSLKVLNPENGKLPRGQQMIDAILKQNPKLDLSHIPTVSFDKVSARVMSNENMSRFIENLLNTTKKPTSGDNGVLNTDTSANIDTNTNTDILEDEEIPF